MRIIIRHRLATGRPVDLDITGTQEELRVAIEMIATREASVPAPAVSGWLLPRGGRPVPKTLIVPASVCRCVQGLLIRFERRRFDSRAPIVIAELVDEDNALVHGWFSGSGGDVDAAIGELIALVSDHADPEEARRLFGVIALGDPTSGQLFAGWEVPGGAGNGLAESAAQRVAGDRASSEGVGDGDASGISDARDGEGVAYRAGAAPSE